MPKDKLPQADQMPERLDPVRQAQKKMDDEASRATGQQPNIDMQEKLARQRSKDEREISSGPGPRSTPRHDE